MKLTSNVRNSWQLQQTVLKQLSQEIRNKTFSLEGIRRMGGSFLDLDLEVKILAASPEAEEVGIGLNSLHNPRNVPLEQILANATLGLVTALTAGGKRF